MSGSSGMTMSARAAPGARAPAAPPRLVGVLPPREQAAGRLAPAPPPGGEEGAPTRAVGLPPPPGIDPRGAPRRPAAADPVLNFPPAEIAVVPFREGDPAPGRAAIVRVQDEIAALRQRLHRLAVA